MKHFVDTYLKINEKSTILVNIEKIYFEKNKATKYRLP